MSCISSAVRLVLWFSKVQFLKRLADRVDYYERSEVCMFSFAKQGNGFRARPVGGAGDGVAFGFKILFPSHREAVRFSILARVNLTSTILLLFSMVCLFSLKFYIYLYN